MAQNSNTGGFKIKPLLIDRQLSGQRMSECCSNEEDDHGITDDQQQDVVNIGLVGGRAVTRRTTMVGPEITETARHAKKKQHQSLMIE